MISFQTSLARGAELGGKARARSKSRERTFKGKKKPTRLPAQKGSVLWEEGSSRGLRMSRRRG